MKRMGWFGVLAGILTGVLLALGCGSGSGSGGDAVFEGAPVIIISVDTLRSDRLPVYGYDGVETPAIDAFRAESILFEKAYSHYPLTLPSHTSVFTGLLPTVHGVRDNVGYLFDASAHPYLPKILKQEGYATGAAVSTFVLRAHSGLGEGFDFYNDRIEMEEDPTFGAVQRPGMETLDIALDWLDDVKGETPFLFFHIYEPHTPYAPPEPYRSRYASAYDGEVAYSDEILGKLFEALKARGLYDRSILLMLSDHGEGLMDHGEMQHGILLYREAIQVPLILRLPGGRDGGATVTASAQLADVTPTILDLLGLDVPASMQGMSLLDLKREPIDRPIYAETHYPRLHMGWNDLLAVVEKDHHYIEGPDPELFDLVDDPAQKTNVLATERRLYADLRASLDALKVPLKAPSEVDAETVQRLAALGYTGAPNLTTDGPLPDPKSQVHVLEEFWAAVRAIGEERFAEAIPVLQRLLRENPRMQDGWERLALALAKVGRREDAVGAYKKALENAGASSHVAINLSTVLLELGRVQEAKEHAELALPTAPALAHQRLAEIALVDGDLEEAKARIDAAVAERADDPTLLVLRAQIASRSGALDAAREDLETVDSLLATSKRNRPPQGYHMVRADLAARLGDAAASERAFLEEIRLFPENLDAYSRLAVLYATLGRAQEAYGALRSMVESNGGSPAAYVTAVETFQILGDGQAAASLLRHALGLYPADTRLRSLAQPS